MSSTRRLNSDLDTSRMSGAQKTCFLLSNSRDFRRPQSIHPASLSACNKAGCGTLTPLGAAPARRSHSAWKGDATTPLENSPKRLRMRSTKYDSAMLMPCSTRFILNSVIMGAAPALKAVTSRRASQPPIAAKPPDLYHFHIFSADAGDMRGACDQTQNHLRSWESKLIGTGSLENANTNTRFAI